MTEPTISRKQAWCKLAVLIADGLPEPSAISFGGGDHNLVTVTLDFADDLFTWADRLGVTLSGPTYSAEPGKWLNNGYNWAWHGHALSLWCSNASSMRQSAPVESMAAVRELAGAA
jgi:hypothetical protein